MSLLLDKKTSKTQQKQSNYIQQPIQTVDGQVRIKKYTKLKVVGSGSYSKCYLVKNTDSDSTYVAKVIPKKKLQILQKQKLIYEIKIHQSLSHQNVVHLDHWFQDQNNQYIFMQYCPNGNLQTKLSEVQNMSQKDIKKYGSQIVHALMYIHNQNILHRDLKLCNFYLDENDNVKLGDFGFACQLASQYDRKRQTCGTPNYIAPQAISGFGYSYSSDVWAIGVILFRLRYGVCPFQGQSVKKTLQNVKLCNFKFPSKPKISPQLKDLIEKIFNLNYDQRLTTQQILEHRFFDDQTFDASPQKKELNEQKRGFSLSRLFSRDKNKNDQKKKDSKKQSENNKQPQSRGRQGMLQRQSRNPTISVKKQQQPKRSNSCQTFKQIKQIFKNKSKQNILSQNYTQSSNITKRDLGPSPYYTLNTISSTNRDKQQNSKTNRNSIAQYSYTYSINLNITQGNSILNNNNNNNNKQDINNISNNRSNRLNQFIKSQVNTISLKQQLKMNKVSKNNSLTTTNNTNIQQNSIEKGQQLTNQVHTNNNNNNTNNDTNLTTNAYFLKSNQNKNQPHTHIPTSTQNIPTQNPTLKISKNSLTTPSQQQLIHYSRRYYLPTLIQQQKDVLIIHYKPSVKQIIYSNIGYIIHRNITTIFKMTGQLIQISQLPKVFKYILQNKVDIKQYQQQQDYQYGQNTINKIIQHIPNNWIIIKDGIILKYIGYNNLIVAKLFAQEGYYMIDDHGQALMYNIGNDHIPKIFEGIVIMRIYSGWVKTYYKKQK